METLVSAQMDDNDDNDDDDDDNQYETFIFSFIDIALNKNIISFMRTPENYLTSSVSDDGYWASSTLRHPMVHGHCPRFDIQWSMSDVQYPTSDVQYPAPDIPYPTSAVRCYMVDKRYSISHA